MLIPTISTTHIGKRNVYRAKSFVGNTNSGGNLACLKSDRDRTIVGNIALKRIAPQISSTHIFRLRSLSLKNCLDHNGNANAMNK